MLGPPAVRDRAAFLRAVALRTVRLWWWILATATVIVGGSVFAYLRFAHHRPLVVGAAVAVLALLLLEGAFREWRDANARQASVEEEKRRLARERDSAFDAAHSSRSSTFMDDFTERIRRATERSNEEAYRQRQPPARIDALLRTGHELREALRDHEHDPVECRDAYIEWEQRTAQELKEVSPADLDAFVDAGGKSPLAMLNARMAVLSQARKHAT